jgi:dissimilatory sulfite reductase (desulfoviridin) alpha/beta subunit|tara:strand:+ start:122 stop:301 length:180 start_codon:yes stop_codon:yes gene_type:complete
MASKDKTLLITNIDDDQHHKFKVWAVQNKLTQAEALVALVDIADETSVDIKNQVITKLK